MNYYMNTNVGTTQTKKWKVISVSCMTCPDFISFCQASLRHKLPLIKEKDPPQRASSGFSQEAGKKDPIGLGCVRWFGVMWGSSIWAGGSRHKNHGQFYDWRVSTSLSRREAGLMSHVLSLTPVGVLRFRPGLGLSVQTHSWELCSCPPSHLVLMFMSRTPAQLWDWSRGLSLRVHTHFPLCHLKVSFITLGIKVLDLSTRQ